MAGGAEARARGIPKHERVHTTHTFLHTHTERRHPTTHTLRPNHTHVHTHNTHTPSLWPSWLASEPERRPYLLGKMSQAHRPSWGLRLPAWHTLVFPAHLGPAPGLRMHTQAPCVGAGGAQLRAPAAASNRPHHALPGCLAPSLLQRGPSSLGTTPPAPRVRPYSRPGALLPCAQAPSLRHAVCTTSETFPKQLTGPQSLLPGAHRRPPHGLLGSTPASFRRPRTWWGALVKAPI